MNEDGQGVPPELLRLADAGAWAAGVVLLAAHPDDETIGAGGVLPRLPLLAVVHVTDGAPADPRWWGDPALASREVYAGVRRAELACALALAGVGADRLRSFGRQDQRAAHHLPALARDMAALLDELRPGVVLTHPYEGGHPDHDAAAFAVHTARELMVSPPPVLVEFTSYHASGQGIATGTFLPWTGDDDEPAPVGLVSQPVPPLAVEVREGGLRAVVAATSVANSDHRHPHHLPPSAAVSLSSGDRERKRRMLECFGTQRQTLALIPVADAERFRIAPEYDFTAAPHAGQLYYERFDWGITGEEWRAAASDALEALGISGGVRC